VSEEKELRPMNVVVYLFKKYLCGRVLDAGCGNGRHLILMPEGSVGLDIEINNLWLKEKYELVRADLNYTLPFSNEVFDVIFCSHALEHLESPWRTLKEFHRVLKERGWLILGIPNPNCFYFDFYTMRDHIYAWNESQMRKFLAKCGFRVRRIYTNFPFRNEKLGVVWSSLFKRIFADLWFVAVKEEEELKLTARRDILNRIVLKGLRRCAVGED